MAALCMLYFGGKSQGTNASEKQRHGSDEQMLLVTLITQTTQKKRFYIEP